MSNRFTSRVNKSSEHSYSITRWNHYGERISETIAHRILILDYDNCHCITLCLIFLNLFNHFKIIWCYFLNSFLNHFLSLLFLSYLFVIFSGFLQICYQLLNATLFLLILPVSEGTSLGPHPLHWPEDFSINFQALLEQDLLSSLHWVTCLFLLYGHFIVVITLSHFIQRFQCLFSLINEIGRWFISPLDCRPGSIVDLSSLLLSSVISEKFSAHEICLVLYRGSR